MPQPFSTQEGDADVAMIAPQSEETSQDGNWSQLMRLVPVRHPKIQGVALEGETVLFDLRTGRSYRLNSLGTAIWEQCTGMATLHEIHRAVCAQLNVSIERMHEDVVTSIAQWSHEGLLVQAGTAQG